jgi:hypothetical protein
LALGLAVPALCADLTGTVVAAAGGPIAEATVITYRDGELYGLATWTDHQGRYHVPLKPGRYQVSVTHFGYVQKTVEVEVEGERVVADLVLSPDSPIFALPLGESFPSHVARGSETWAGPGLDADVVDWHVLAGIESALKTAFPSWTVRHDPPSRWGPSVRIRMARGSDEIHVETQFMAGTAEARRRLEAERMGISVGAGPREYGLGEEAYFSDYGILRFRQDEFVIHVTRVGSPTSISADTLRQVGSFVAYAIAQRSSE